MQIIHWWIIKEILNILSNKIDNSKQNVFQCNIFVWKSISNPAEVEVGYKRDGFSMQKDCQPCISKGVW